MAYLIASWDLKSSYDYSGNGHTLQSTSEISQDMFDGNSMVYAPALTGFSGGLTIFIEYTTPSAGEGGNQVLAGLSKITGGGLMVLVEYASSVLAVYSTKTIGGFTPPNDYTTENQRCAVRCKKLSANTVEITFRYANGLNAVEVVDVNYDSCQPFSIGCENPNTGASSFFVGRVYGLNLYDGTVTDDEIDKFFTLGFGEFTKARSIVDSVDPFGDGSLVAKYQLNGDLQDTTGKHHGTNPNNLVFDEGKFGSSIQTKLSSYGALSGSFPVMYSFSLSFWHQGGDGFGMGNEWGAFGLHQHVNTGQFFVGTDVASRGLVNSTEMNLEHDFWNHLAVTINGTEMNVYINSVLVLTKTVTASTGVTEMVIGSYSTSALNYACKIDQVEIYNRALTEKEVGQLFKQEIGQISWLDMGEIPEGLAVYPEDAVLSTTVGTGFLNNSGFPVYYRANNNISRGETKHIVNANLTVISKVEFAEDGTLTLTENGTVSTVNTELEIISFRHQNGQLAFTNEAGTAELYSFYFHYADCFASVKSEDGETVDDLNDVVLSNPLTAYWFNYSALPYSVVWSNRETIEQANPQPEQVTYQGKELQKCETVVKNNVFYNNPVLDQNGEQHKFGYIESTTEISGVPVPNKRVLCFAQDTGLLIDEAISDENGVYRFDYLLLSKKFMITAQFGNDDSTSPPEYQAVSADWQTPTAYGTVKEEDQ